MKNTVPLNESCTVQQCLACILWVELQFSVLTGQLMSLPQCTKSCAHWSLTLAWHPRFCVVSANSYEWFCCVCELALLSVNGSSHLNLNNQSRQLSAMPACQPCYCVFTALPEQVGWAAIHRSDKSREEGAETVLKLDLRTTGNSSTTCHLMFKTSKTIVFTLNLTVRYSDNESKDFFFF